MFTIAGRWCSTTNTTANWESGPDNSKQSTLFYSTLISISSKCFTHPTTENTSKISTQAMETQKTRKETLLGTYSTLILLTCCNNCLIELKGLCPRIVHIKVESRGIKIVVAMQLGWSSVIHDKETYNLCLYGAKRSAARSAERSSASNFWERGAEQTPKIFHSAPAREILRESFLFKKRQIFGKMLTPH